MKRKLKIILVCLCLWLLMFGAYHFNLFSVEDNDLAQEIAKFTGITEVEKLVNSLQSYYQIRAFMKQSELRIEGPIGIETFIFDVIDKSNFFGKNSAKYEYYFDYDVGVKVKNIEYKFDSKNLVTIISIKKKSFEIFRIREDVEKRKCIERDLSNFNKFLNIVNPDDWANIDSKSFQENELDALKYAEKDIEKKRTAWLNKNEINEFENLFESFKEEVEKQFKIRGFTKYRIIYS